MAVSLSDERQRVAEVIVAIGPERASQVLRSLPESDVERILGDVARIGPLAPERARAIITDVAQTLAVRATTIGGFDFAERLLVDLYGPERAEQLAPRIDPRAAVPFAWLRAAGADQIARALRNEPPASIALALAHLDAELAAPVLRQFEPALRSDVAHRIAALTRIAPDVVAAIDASMRQRLSGTLGDDALDVPGVDVVVEVLNRLPPKQQRALVEAIKERDEKLAARINESLFTFEDIALLTDRAIQEVLKSVDTLDLAMALHADVEGLGARIFKNLSERAAANLREEIEYLQTPRPPEVKMAKARIVASVRQLEESGAIQVQRAGSSDDSEDDE